MEPTPPPVLAEVVVSPQSTTLTAVGEEAQLWVVPFGEDGREMFLDDQVWTSSDESVATVDSDGVVEAVGAGTATISVEVTDHSGVTESGSAEVVVQP